MKTPLVLFYLSCLLAFVAGHTVNYSVILFAQDILHSDLLSGIGFGLCFGPPLFFGWYAGVLCDRLAPSRIILFSQLIFIIAGGLLFLSTLVDTDLSKAALLIVAAFLSGVGWSFIAPARFATLAQIVVPEKLHGATVLLNLLTMLGFGLAPIIIALLRKSYGWDGVFIGIIIAFTVASILIRGTHTEATQKPKNPALHEIREGFRAVLAKPLLLQFLLANLLAYTLMGPMQVLLPRLASSQLQLEGIERGIYLGTLALALLVGGVLCMALKRRIHDGSTILAGILASGVAVIFLSQISSPAFSAFILLVSGIIGGMVVSLIVAGLQAETGPDVRGRIMSMYTISSQVIPAASGFAAGALSEYFGVVAAMALCGAFIIMSALVGLFKLGAVRKYGRAY